MPAAPELTAQAAAAIGVHDREQLGVIVSISRSNMQILKLPSAFTEISAPRMVTWCELGGTDASPPTARILHLNLQVEPTKPIFCHNLVVNTSPLYNQIKHHTYAEPTPMYICIRNFAVQHCFTSPPS